MDDDSVETIERQLARFASRGLAPRLRESVLANVRQELRAARWDRRLARAAAVLLALGVGMNAAIGLRSADSQSARIARGRPAEARPSLVETAIVVAEATDAPTAHRFARKMAALAGRKLTDDEAAAIEAAVRRASPHGNTGNKG